jgi:hypothetical protein
MTTSDCIRWYMGVVPLHNHTCCYYLHLFTLIPRSCKFSFKGIVSRDFVVCFVVSFNRYDVPTHMEWVLLLLKFRFCVTKKHTTKSRETIPLIHFDSIHNQCNGQYNQPLFLLYATCTKCDKTPAIMLCTHCSTVITTFALHKTLYQIHKYNN